MTGWMNLSFLQFPCALSHFPRFGEGTLFLVTGQTIPERKNLTFIFVKSFKFNLSNSNYVDTMQGIGTQI